MTPATESTFTGPSREFVDLGPGFLPLGNPINMSGWGMDASEEQFSPPPLIPEPSTGATIVLLATAVAGLRRWRHRIQ